MGNTLTQASSLELYKRKPREGKAGGRQGCVHDFCSWLWMWHDVSTWVPTLICPFNDRLQPGIIRQIILFPIIMYFLKYYSHNRAKYIYIFVFSLLSTKFIKMHLIPPKHYFSRTYLRIFILKFTHRPPKIIPLTNAKWCVFGNEQISQIIFQFS